MNYLETYYMNKKIGIFDESYFEENHMNINKKIYFISRNENSRNSNFYIFSFNLLSLEHCSNSNSFEIEGWRHHWVKKTLYDEIHPEGNTLIRTTSKYQKGLPFVHACQFIFNFNLLE